MRLTARSGARVLLVVLLAVLAGWSMRPVRAQEYDGKYVGSITCEAIPGQTGAPLKTDFTMSVAAGRAQYEREVLPPNRNEKLGVTENGTGTVSSTSEVSLTGSVARATWGYEATYTGRGVGNAIRLSGTQIWRLPGRSGIERPCSITLSRSQ